MKKLILILLLIFLNLLLFPRKVGVLSEVMKPDNINIYQDDLFVAEGSSIYIYSLTNLKLKMKFGRKGEGPGEILYVPNYPTRVHGFSDFILVEGINKILFFNREGKFLKEIRKPTGTTQLVPIGKNFVAKRIVPSEDNRTVFSAIFIYDSDLKQLKSLYQQRWVQQGAPPSIKIDVVGDFVHFRICDNKIFIEESPKGFIISVFDENGNQLYQIKKPFEPLKISAEQKEKLLTKLKEDPWVKPQINALGGWDEVKKIIQVEFPDYFPPIKNLDISDNKLLVQTHRGNQNREEYIIMDLKGNIEKKVFIPKRIETPLMARLMGVKLYAIQNHQLYYIKENEEDEEWELHVEKIK